MGPGERGASGMSEQTQQELAREHRIELVAIHLPLSVTTAARVMKAIDREFPGSMAITRHSFGEQNLVIQVDVASHPDEDDDDEEAPGGD